MSATENLNHENPDRKEGQENPQVKDVGAMDETEKRREIGRLGQELSRKNLISDQSARFYEQVASGTEESGQKIDSNILEKILTHAQKLTQNSGRVYGLLEKAVKDGYANKEDQAFLIKEIVYHPDFMNRFTEAERTVREKVERMKQRKDAYIKMANHPCVEDGKIKTGKNGPVYAVKKEKDFMAMKPKEKEAELGKMKEAILKAKAYFKAELPTAYKAGLAKKNVSQKTREAYQKEFDGLKTISERERYLKALDDPTIDPENNINTRQKFCDRMEKTFQGQELEKFKSLKDGMGLTEMQALEVKLTGEINGRYINQLTEYRDEEKIIGKTTFNQYKNWIENAEEAKSPAAKYNALDQLDKGQMQHRRELWGKIRSDQTPKEIQFGMEKMRDIFGYTDLKSKYNELMGISDTGGHNHAGEGEGNPETELKNKVVSGTATNGIIETANHLMAQGAAGKSKIRSLSDLLTRATRNMQTQSFDSFQVGLEKQKRKAGIQNEMREAAADQTEISGARVGNVLDLQSRIRVKRHKEEGEMSAESPEINAQKPMDRSGIEKDIGKLEKTERIKVTHLEQLTDVDDRTEGGKRRVMATIGKGEKGIDNLLSRDRQKQIGEGELSLAAETETIKEELTLNQIRAMQEYLKKKEEEFLKQGKKAA